MTGSERNREFWKYKSLWFSVVLTLCIAALDVMTPQGVAEGMFYVVPVLLAMWTPLRHFPLALAAVCSLLVLVGMWVSPALEQPAELVILPNRAYTLVVIWAAALVAWQRNLTRHLLKQHNEQLERRVAERTAKLAGTAATLQEEVVNRQRMESELRRSNQELLEFASVASHDLQEPLRGVTSFLELVQHQYGDRLNTTGREYIGHASESAKRMQAMVHDLLDAARIRSHGKPFATVDLNQSVQEAIGRLATAIEESGSEITCDALPTVNGDARQLLQLLQNLIGNAIKYRGDQAPRIQVGAEEADGHWELSVRDNGIGIEARHQDRIFGMFERLHTRSKYPGTGIGLALCVRIVQRHGGRIWVQSEPGQGSTFYFTIAKNAVAPEFERMPVSRLAR